MYVKISLKHVVINVTGLNVILVACKYHYFVVQGEEIQTCKGSK